MPRRKTGQARTGCSTKPLWTTSIGARTGEQVIPLCVSSVALRALPTPSARTLKGRPPPSVRRRGSDKAFKYLKARFTLSHVKVQNLSLLVRPPTTSRDRIAFIGESQDRDQRWCTFMCTQSAGDHDACTCTIRAMRHTLLSPCANI